MTAMLDATLERWEKAKVAEGVERGRAQGLAQGVERGLAQGVQRGLAEGAARGRVALLGRITERRFGPGVAGQLTALLADESNLSRLDDVGDWLMECDTGEALLARLQAARRATS